MMARRLSSVAARTASAEAVGVRPSMALPSLASTAGHNPSMADSQSGRAAGSGLGVQLGFLPASRAWSGRVAKKACQLGSTDDGFSAQRA